MATAVPKRLSIDISEDMTESMGVRTGTSEGGAAQATLRATGKTQAS
ncbi:hypothetical protein GCM10009079_12960 [Ralstonia mannitolilytica]